MNKNSILGFILIAAIMIGYTYWFTPSSTELAQRKHTADSLANIEQQRIQQELARQAAFEQEAELQQPAEEVMVSTDQNLDQLREKIRPVCRFR